MSYARSVRFSTTSENEEILTKEEIKEVLMDVVNTQDEEVFQMAMINGIIVNVDVFTKDTRIKINDGIYNDLIENKVYSSNNYIRLHSVKCESPAEGVIVFTARGE